LGKSRDRTGLSPTGSVTRPITRLGTTPREDTGEEQN